MFDSSPKGGFDTIGAVLDISRRTARCDVEPVKRTNVSGATSRQCCHDTLQNTFTLLWRVYLQAGPPLDYFRSKLRQVRCTTADCIQEQDACAVAVRTSVAAGCWWLPALRLYQLSVLRSSRKTGNAPVRRCGICVEHIVASAARHARGELSCERTCERPKCENCTCVVTDAPTRNSFPDETDRLQVGKSLAPL